MSEQESKLRHHCNSCARNTKHKVLFERETQEEEQIDGYGPISWSDTYELLECLGCETVCMKHSNYFDPTGDTTVSSYPPKVTRRKPRWVHQLPAPVQLLLEQVYQALDANGRALALMGARAVVDMVMVDAAGDQGSFPAKLDAFENHGHIGAKSKEVLRIALDAGSAASHRGYQPSPDDVNAVMEIVENLLQSVYQLASLADRLKKATPPRQ